MNNLIYLKSVSTLIEVLDKDKDVFIGNTKLTNNLGNPFKDGFHNANWNRAIKLANDSIDTKSNHNDDLTYYKLDIDLYLDLDKQTIVCLSKKPKNRFITELKEFNDEMVPKLVKGYNNNKVINDIDLTWVLKQYIDFEYVDHQPLKVNRWIVDNNFDFKNRKYKWKVLIVKSDHVGFELTKSHQFIYYYNDELTKTKENSLTSIASFIDLDNGEFYINGYYPLKPNNLVLNIKVPDIYEQDRIKNIVYNQFKEYFKQNKLVNYHLFNITNDSAYLVALIKEQYSSLNYEQLMNQLNEGFKELSRSYYAELLNNKEIVEELRNRLDKTNLDELKEFEQTLNKFKD